MVEGTPLLGFKDILGLGPKFFTIYSIMVEESYSESAMTATGFKLRVSFTKSSWGITTCVPLTLACKVASTRGS